MFRLPDRPQKIGEVLDGCFRLYAATFRTTVWFGLLAGTAITLPQFVMRLWAGAQTSPPPLPVVAVAVGLALALLIPYVALLLAILHYVGTVALGEEATFAGSLGVGFRRLLAALGISVLYMIAVTLGTVLLVIPGLILMVSLFLATACLLFSGDGVIASLRHSHRLVWGAWWRTTVILTIVTLLYGLVATAVQLPLVFIDATLQGGVHGGGLLTLVGSLVSNTVALPLVVAAEFVIYHELRLRKEGGDLEARLEQLAARA